MAPRGPLRDEGPAVQCAHASLNRHSTNLRGTPEFRDRFSSSRSSVSSSSSHPCGTGRSRRRSYWLLKANQPWRIWNGSVGRSCTATRRTGDSRTRARRSARRRRSVSVGCTSHTVQVTPASSSNSRCAISPASARRTHTAMNQVPWRTARGSVCRAPIVMTGVGWRLEVHSRRSLPFGHLF